MSERIAPGSDSAETVVQVTQLFPEVMLCPPSGRGVVGGALVGWSETGRPLALWSHPTNGQRLTFRRESFQDKVKFGGRVILFDGHYFVFGKKRLAQAFLDELTRPSTPLETPPASRPPHVSSQSNHTTAPTISGNRVHSSADDNSDPDDADDDPLEQEYSTLVGSFWAGVAAISEVPARHPGQAEALMPLMEEWLEEAGNDWASVALKAIGERRAFYGTHSRFPSIPLIEMLTAEEILRDPLVAGHIQEMHWDSWVRPEALPSSTDDDFRVWQACWDAGFKWLETRTAIIARCNAFEMRGYGDE